MSTLPSLSSQTMTMVSRPTLLIDDVTIQGLAAWDEIIEVLRNAYRFDVPASMVPPRTTARMDGAWLRSLAAISSDGKLMGAKLVAASSKKGLASYLIALFDAETMELAALLDGNQITGLRTAGASAVAAEALAPERPVSVAVLGSGFEARKHLTAISQVRGISEARVFSPNAGRREAFSSFFRDSMHMSVSASSSPQEALEGADVVICAARSHDESAILHGAWVEAGMTILSIGSTNPEQREVEHTVIERSDLIVADVLEEVLFDSGDLIHAAAMGVEFQSKARSLESVVSGSQPGRTADEQTILYKSVGSAKQDIAVAQLMLKRAMDEHAGNEIPGIIAPVTK